MDPDFIIQNEGTIVLFRPLTPEADAHIGDNVQDDAQWFGGALVVEHRFAHDLAQELIGHGFILS